MQFKKSRRLVPQVNIVSMIDVVLLLLLFFMLTTTFKFTAEGMSVDLPETKAPLKSAPLESVVTLNKEGEIYYGERKVSLALLGEELRELASARADSLVVIKADKEVRHGWVVEIMDAINLAGVKRIAIATEPSAEQR